MASSKGRVTIPQHTRERLGIRPHSEVDFVVKDEDVVLVKIRDADREDVFERVRGIATVDLRTDEIMALTRDEDDGSLFPNLSGQQCRSRCFYQRPQLVRVVQKDASSLQPNSSIDDQRHYLRRSLGELS